MKKLSNFFAALLVCLSVICLAACEKAPEGNPGISQDSAKTMLQRYLENKGFDSEKDFLDEAEIMVLDGEKVYSFSWRTKVSDNADRLFGMYAISFDGNSFYEYQSARDEWIKDMNAE